MLLFLCVYFIMNYSHSGGLEEKMGHRRRGWATSEHLSVALRRYGQ